MWIIEKRKAAKRRFSLKEKRGGVMHCFVFWCPMSSTEEVSKHERVKRVVRVARIMMVRRWRGWAFWILFENRNYYRQPVNLFVSLFCLGQQSTDWTIHALACSFTNEKWWWGKDRRKESGSGGEPPIFAYTAYQYAHPPIHPFYITTLRHHFFELRVRWRNESVNLSNNAWLHKHKQD